MTLSIPACLSLLSVLTASSAASASEATIGPSPAPLLLAQASPASSGPGQPAAPTPAQAGPAAPEVGQEPAEPLISIRFPGGTVSDFVEAVRRVSGEVNIVVLPEALEVRLPPIELSSVSTETALSVLEQVGTRSSQALTVADARGRQRSARGAIVPGPGSPAFVIGVDLSGQGRLGGPSPRQTRVEPLTRVLSTGRLSSDAILEAVEAAVRSTGLSSETILVYHEPTALLIATGPEPALQAVRNVLAAVSPMLSGDDLKAAQERQKQLEREAASAAQDLVATQTRFEVLLEELRAREAQTGKLREDLTAVAVERRAMEAEVRLLMQAREEAQRAAAAAQKRLEEVEVRLVTTNRSLEAAMRYAERLQGRLQEKGIAFEDIKFEK